MNRNIKIIEMKECKKAFEMMRNGKIPIQGGVFVDAYFGGCLYNVSGCITTRIGNNKYFVTELKDEQNNNTDKRDSR